MIRRSRQASRGEPIRNEMWRNVLLGYVVPAVKAIGFTCLVVGGVLFGLQYWEDRGACPDGTHKPTEASCLDSSRVMELAKHYIASHPDHPKSDVPEFLCYVDRYVDLHPHWIAVCDGSRFSIDDRTEEVHVNLAY